MPETIDIADFVKLELRIATIKRVEEIAGADKLFKLTIDVGELGERIICAGIKQFYSADSLVNKQIVIVANLSPITLRGVESHGMLLAASSEDRTKLSIISPDAVMAPGSKVG